MTSNEFLESLPAQVPAEALEGHEVVFHFEIEGGGTKTVTVSGGKLEVVDGLHGEADCRIRTKEEHFVKVLNGELKPAMAVLTGKLKISNMGVMTRYAKLFGLA